MPLTALGVKNAKPKDLYPGRNIVELLGALIPDAGQCRPVPGADLIVVRQIIDDIYTGKISCDRPRVPLLHDYGRGS